MKKDLLTNIILRRLVYSLYRLPKFKGRYYLAYFLRFFFIMPKNPIVIKILGDILIEVNPRIDKGVESALFFTGVYEIGTLRFLKENLKSGMTFIDVGANIGLLTIVASKLVGEKGKVFAYEPNPPTLEILKRNLWLNRIENVVVREVALGSKSGEFEIYPNWDVNRGGASLVRRGAGESGVNIKVEVLDIEIGKLDLKPSLIKIDVEGYEAEVLNGAQMLLDNSTNLSLIIEISSERVSEGGNSHEIVQKLMSAGFALYMNAQGKESNSEVIEISNLQLNKINHDNIYFIR